MTIDKGGRPRKEDEKENGNNHTRTMFSVDSRYDEGDIL